MKTTILIPLSFVLFLFSSANSVPDSVLDTYGKILRSGIDYLAMPVDRYGPVAGITLLATGNNDSCPAGVAQFQPGENSAFPLTFTPVKPKKGVIRLSTDVNIKFTAPNLCNESNVWRIEYDESVKQHFVMLGGVEGNPGRETLYNWFKIEKSENGGYKFVFCPTVCDYSCEVICRDVGIFIDGNGVRRLALSDVPFSVVFMR